MQKTKLKDVENTKIELPLIGEALFVPSAKAKYIRISLKPFGGIRVTVPLRTSMRQALAFVETKTDWIIQAQSRVAEREKQYIIFTPDTDFSTKNRKLKLLPWKSGQFRAQLTKDTLKIFYPQDIEIRSDKAQETIRNHITNTLREEAKEYLPKRTKQLAEKHGFSYFGVTVKNISSRWGSCSARNHINLNIHLVRLPEHLSDYVIIHELTHTVHKNHGNIFWQTLNRLTDGKAKLLAAEIKKYHSDKF